MLQRAASNAYSWWWASHIRTTQSKWLDTNLQDMEAMIKRILFLLGEDADTFAKRAEMYYKRRPEVIGAVEEAYRAYRALAERYDHMSGELHRANHTVAAAFPDQVHYAMLDQDKLNDDDNGVPRAFTTVDPRKVRKATVHELMKKKQKKNDKRGKNHAATPVSDQAEIISRLQKEILVLQTEKEFIKSCYESGIARFWDLEKQINDMQEDVCCFQDEFGENSAAVIEDDEDDEARALMTASALKSCRNAIAKLQKRQRSCFGQAAGELERASVSKQKLKKIMENHGMSLPDSGDSQYENAPQRRDVSVQIQIDDVEREKEFEMEAMVDKIKGYFQRDAGISVADIAEKIDEVVDKVADLELMASSQDAKIERMCLENTDLEKSLHELEQEEENMTAVVSCRSGELVEKIDKAKDELMRVQHLQISFHAQESVVCSNFSGTATSFYDIMDMLQLQSSSMIEHRADHAADTLTDEAVASSPSDKCEGTEPEVIDPVMDQAAREPETDGDCLSKMELPVSSDQSSGAYPDPDQIQPENHHHVGDDSENLLHYGIEETSISADAPVHYETRENADDNNTFGERENSEGEQHADEIVADSEEPYIVQSEGRDSSKQETTNGVEEDSENSVPGNSEVASVGDQEENMAHLQKLLMIGLQDKEKLLLTEYTSILRNYKNTKKALEETEMKNQEHISGMAAMVNELRRANVAKDDEIRSLHELLNSSTDKNASKTSNQIDRETSSSFRSGNFRGGHRRSSASSFSRRGSVSSISRILMNSSSNLEKTGHEGDESLLHDVVMDPESIHLEELKLTNIAETESFSPIDAKFRRDIDGILEENLDFWLNFSTSLQKIKEFGSRHEQIQSETCKSETESAEKQTRLRELKIDLQVWLEQTAMLKEELQCRFTSLCAIHDEIQEEEEGDRLAPHQAAKFTGEIISMKQENSKVSVELRAGVDHVRDLQAELVEKLTPKILDGSAPRRDAAFRQRVPLRSFLFPAKRKKKKKTPSLLSCVNPALQKQHSDMEFLR